MSLTSTQSTQQDDSLNHQDEMQSMALQMEQARSRLQTILLNNPSGQDLIGQHFLSSLHKKIDISELVNCKFSDGFVVQNESSVQPNHKQICELIALKLTEAMTRSGQQESELQLIHFLPVFLLQVAERAIKATPDDEGYRQELVRLHHSLQNTRQQMVMQNRRLVAFTARRLDTGNIPFHDVMQEGMVGLLKAVDRFDHRRDIRFSTYASYWIKQTISRLVMRQDKIVRLPFGLAEKVPTVFGIMRTFYLNENRWPSIAEIKLHCELTEEEIKIIVSFYQAALATHSSDNDEDDSKDEMADLEQRLFQLPLEALMDQSLSHIIIQAVDSLPKREADILTLRFGLKNHHEMTLQAIAEQMQLTRERIRQIQNIALKKLQHNFAIELKLYLQTSDGH